MNSIGSVPRGTSQEPHWSWYPFYFWTIKNKLLWWTSDNYQIWVNEKNPDETLIRENLSQLIKVKRAMVGGIISSWVHAELIQEDGIRKGERPTRREGMIRRYHWTGHAHETAKFKARSVELG